MLTEEVCEDKVVDLVADVSQERERHKRHSVVLQYTHTSILNSERK